MKQIKLNFKLEKMKMITKVAFNGSATTRDLIIDTGCSLTTMSHTLFKRLKYKKTDSSPITILGLNSEEKSKSVIIPSFIISNHDIGPIRIALATLKAEFQNKILLGMNVLAWFHWDVDMQKKVFTLTSRNYGSHRKLSDFFVLKNPQESTLLYIFSPL